MTAAFICLTAAAAAGETITKSGYSSARPLARFNAFSEHPDPGSTVIRRSGSPNGCNDIQTPSPQRVARVKQTTERKQRIPGADIEVARSETPRLGDNLYFELETPLPARKFLPEAAIVGTVELDTRNNSVSVTPVEPHKAAKDNDCLDK